MELLNQLGGLFLSAIPTVILVFFFYLFMRSAFFLPIVKVMAERKARIEGARKEADTLHATVIEKQRAHQEALRKARTQIFTEQEAARRVVLEERSAAVQQARSRANEQIQTAKTRITAEIQAARAELNTTGDQLAEEIVQAILTPAGRA